jgi:hypothetical protein
MKKITTICVAAFFLLSSIVSAVCLKGNLSIKEEYANSDSVFVGKVLKKKYVPESGGYYDGNEYTVQVKEIFKGNPNKNTNIFSENTSGRFPMAEGKTYIIFLYSASGRQQINNCGNSGLKSKKEDTLKTLKQLKQNETNK